MNKKEYEMLLHRCEYYLYHNGEEKYNKDERRIEKKLDLILKLLSESLED